MTNPIDDAMHVIKLRQRQEKLRTDDMKYNPAHHQVTELGDATLENDEDKESAPLYLRRHAQRMINKGEWLSDNEFTLLHAIESLVKDYDDYMQEHQLDEDNPFLYKTWKYQKISHWINQLRSIAQNFLVQEGQFQPNNEYEYAGDLYVQHPRMSGHFVRVTESLDNLPAEYLKDGYTMQSQE